MCKACDQSKKSWLISSQALVANGAKVYVIDRREPALNTVVALYDSGPGKIIPQVTFFLVSTMSHSYDRILLVGLPPILA